MRELRWPQAYVRWKDDGKRTVRVIFIVRFELILNEGEDDNNNNHPLKRMICVYEMHCFPLKWKTMIMISTILSRVWNEQQLDGS